MAGEWPVKGRVREISLRLPLQGCVLHVTSCTGNLGPFSSLVSGHLHTYLIPQSLALTHIFFHFAHSTPLKMTKCLWEDEEIALVLNWIDHCLENDEDFSSTIAEKLRAYQRKYGPARTGDLRGAARKKLNDLTKLQNGPSCATIIAQGTACLIQANCIRPSIQTAINAGRPGLGLGLIDWSPKSTVQKRNSAQHSHPDVDLTVDDSPMDIDDDHSSSQKVLHPAGKDQKVRNDQATSRQTSGSPLTTLASASSEPDTNRHPPHPRASQASKPDKQTASPSGHSLPRPVTQSLQQIQMPLSGPMHSQIQMESIVPHFPLSSGAYSVQRERVSLPLPSSDDLGGEWEAVQFAIKLPGIEKNIPETDSQKLLHHFSLSVSKLSNKFGLSAGCTFELSSIKPGPSVSYSEAVRSVLGHLVCQWVFVSPEPMLPVSFETKLLYNNILKHFRKLRLKLAGATQY